MPTVQQLMLERADPVIVMDQEGLVTHLNDAFEKAYGWKKTELLGRQLANAIIPPELRDAHRIGFSRFMATQSPTILQTPLDLPILCRSGEVKNVEHLIVAAQHEGRWVFAARIRNRSVKRK